MDFEPDELQQMVGDAGRRFVDEIDSFQQRRAAQKDSVATVWDALIDMGWTGIAASELEGGFGGRPEDMVTLMLETGFSSSAQMLLNNIILPTLLLQRSESLVAKAALTNLVNGQSRVAFSGFEFADSSGQQGFNISAAATDSDLRVDGVTRLVMTASIPNQILISGELTLDGGRKPVLILLDSDDAGIEIEVGHLIDGSHFCHLTFDDLRVTSSNILLSGDAVLAAIDDAVALTALCQCAAAVSCMNRAIKLTADYLKMREQFKKPLSEFQALQHRAADMFVASNEAKSLIFFALATWRGDRDSRNRSISACKVKVMDTAGWVTGEAVHLHGGIGFTKEYEVGELYQKVVVMKRLMGNREQHLRKYAAV